MFSEFKAFINRGNVLDLAVAVIIGAAFGKIVTSLTDSVIMPEVVVAEGSTSVTVTVQGGRPGQGSLFLKGYGVGEVNVPVTVQ